VGAAASCSSDPPEGIHSRASARRPPHESGNGTGTIAATGAHAIALFVQAQTQGYGLARAMRMVDASQHPVCRPRPRQHADSTGFFFALAEVATGLRPDARAADK